MLTIIVPVGNEFEVHQVVKSVKIATVSTMQVATIMQTALLHEEAPPAKKPGPVPKKAGSSTPYTGKRRGRKPRVIPPPDEIKPPLLIPGGQNVDEDAIRRAVEANS